MSCCLHAILGFDPWGGCAYLEWYKSLLPHTFFTVSCAPNYFKVAKVSFCTYQINHPIKMFEPLNFSML
jgi:hypothetical protein